MTGSAGLVSAAKKWLERHEQTLLILSAVSIALLFLLYFFSGAVPIFAKPVANLVNILAIALVSIVFASVAWKGLVPAVICMLGIVLMHNAIILPYFPEFFYDYEQTQSSSAEVRAKVAVTMHFILGLGMVAMSMMLAYRPRLLFARNRPEPVSMWSKYPVWHDNAKLVGGYSEPAVPARSLMEDKDRYLLWRYEYVLASIYGTPHLVRPDGLVPKNTEFIRDRESGLLVGIARYYGYFM